jgi:uncharacterized protein YeaO (DUF488 family)
MVRIKRIYEPASESDGYRILVDRLWPRGVSKESAVIDLWLKEIAPSTGLRKWFDHEPKKWRSFKIKYKKELEGNEVLVEKIRDINRQKGSVTLLYSARDEKRNQAIVLQEFL